MTVRCVRRCLPKQLVGHRFRVAGGREFQNDDPENATDCCYKDLCEDVVQ